MDFAAGGMAAEHSLLKTFRDGLYTQLSNPKRRWYSPLFLPPLLPERIPLAFYYIVR